MALYVKDVEVDRLAVKLAALRRSTKTEAVREALLHELERAEGVPSLVERGVAFVNALRERAEPAQGQPADKAFIDGLYSRP
jgi:antitoxin VapB